MIVQAADPVLQELKSLLDEERTMIDTTRLLVMISAAAEDGPQAIFSLVAKGRRGDLYMAQAGRMRALLTVDASAPNEMLIIKIYEDVDTTGEAKSHHLLDAVTRMQNC